ncbi:hypothetical protein CRUP_015705 [Coryphaenoides rupestris]|nr:hypothetical protein CRUP_015705 [Coryphaenoides rupestris]
MVMLSAGRSARVVSGQKVCIGGREQRCYKIAYFRDVLRRVAFWEARQACAEDGSSLLSIESAAEQRDIEHLLQDLRTGASGSSGSGGGIADGDFWIGLTRSEPGEQNLPEQTNSFHSCPDLYNWTDSSAATFRNWYFDEPSCGGEACVVMYHQPTALPGLGGAYLYQWNDDRCNMKHNFICKYGPEPSVATSPKEESSTHVVMAGSSEPSVEARPKEESSTHVVMAGSSGMLLVYVIIPTIPLILLILVASGTCCFQMFSRSKPETKTSVDQSNLWISKGPKVESMEV